MPPWDDVLIGRHVENLSKTRRKKKKVPAADQQHNTTQYSTTSILLHLDGGCVEARGSPDHNAVLVGNPVGEGSELHGVREHVQHQRQTRPVRPYPQLVRLSHHEGHLPDAFVVLHHLRREEAVEVTRGGVTNALLMARLRRC